MVLSSSSLSSSCLPKKTHTQDGKKYLERRRKWVRGNLDWNFRDKLHLSRPLIHFIRICSKDKDFLIFYLTEGKKLISYSQVKPPEKKFSFELRKFRLLIWQFGNKSPWNGSSINIKKKRKNIFIEKHQVER